MNNTCDNCTHFNRPPPGVDEGECRAHPPVIVPTMVEEGSSGLVDDEISFATRFPIVYVESHCGEWQAIP